MFKEERDNIFAYYTIGIAVAELCKHGILYWDLHDKNILFSSPYQAHVADMDDIEFVPFPREIEQYAKGIMNFFLHHDNKSGAAFRFGFIQAAGEIGKRIFDILYNENDLTVLYNKSKNIILKDIHETSLNDMYTKWNAERDNSFINKHLTDGCFYDEYSYFDIMQKHSDEYHEFKKDNQDNLSLIRHEYQVYLVNSHKSGNIIDFISACVSLASIELELNNDTLCFYYFYIAQENLEEHGDPESIKVVNSGIKFLEYKLLQKYGESINNILKNVMINTIILRAREMCYNLFLEIWYWEDYIKEYNIESLQSESELSFYKCVNCGNIDICISNLVKCPKCDGTDVEVLTQIDYFEQLIQKTIDEYSQKNEEPIILPDLTSPERLPLYLEAVKLCEKSHDFKDAIELCELMINYINQNPDIKDNAGYVLIKNIYKSGGIFREENDPTVVYKFFQMDSEYLRTDYEALIFHKLSFYYYYIADHSKAMEYAQKTIDISNNSNRWIFSSYIRSAYTLLYELYKKDALHEKALKCSQISFIFEVLDVKDEAKDFIWKMNDLGQDYYDVGYFGLSHLCFFYALRNHINFYGVKHPKSVTIYKNIAKLYKVKRQFSQSYIFYAMAWKIKNTDDIEKEKLKKDILECMLEAKYNKSFQEWIKEWVELNNDSLSKNFNEEMYVDKKNGEGMSTVNLSSSDLQKFITFE